MEDVTKTHLECKNVSKASKFGKDVNETKASENLLASAAI